MSWQCSASASLLVASQQIQEGRDRATYHFRTGMCDRSCPKKILPVQSLPASALLGCQRKCSLALGLLHKRSRFRVLWTLSGAFLGTKISATPSPAFILCLARSLSCKLYLTREQYVAEDLLCMMPCECMCASPAKICLKICKGDEPL